MENNSGVEFDENGLPMVGWFDILATRFLGSILTLAFYVAPICLGVNFHSVLIKSPLLKHTGTVMGFIFSSISWIPAYFVGGIVFGFFDFAKTVFKLYKFENYCLTMGFVFLMIPAKRIFSRIIERVCFSFYLRKIVFFLVAVLAIECIFLIVEYLKVSYVGSAYGFSIVVMGIVYYAFLSETLFIRRGKRG